MLEDCAGQLLAYPLSGARPDQLTTSRDIGTFLGAWHLPGGTYAEAAACGTTWLEKLNRNGTATTLTIPGAANAGTVQPLGTYGGQMPLLIGGGCDGHFPYSFVDWYNPGAHTAKTVIGGRAWRRLRDPRGSCTRRADAGPGTAADRRASRGLGG